MNLANHLIRTLKLLPIELRRLPSYYLQLFKIRSPENLQFKIVLNKVPLILNEESICVLLMYLY